MSKCTSKTNSTSKPILLASKSFLTHPTPYKLQPKQCKHSRSQYAITHSLNQMAGKRSFTQVVGDKTFSGIANLIKLLPSGTVFLYQFLNPVLSNNGHCHTINKYLTGALIAICGFSCCFSSFTDSYIDEDGVYHYGVATTKGLWPSAEGCDLSSYKLRAGDFIHAIFSLLVFGVVVLLDPNTVGCYYPSFEATQKMLLMVLPPVVGVLSSSVFVMFPNKRHGIGYLPNQTAVAEKK